MVEFGKLSLASGALPQTAGRGWPLGSVEDKPQKAQKQGLQSRRAESRLPPLFGKALEGRVVRMWPPQARMMIYGS
jgi:hypothetical protein